MTLSSNQTAEHGTRIHVVIGKLRAITANIDSKAAKSRTGRPAILVNSNTLQQFTQSVSCHCDAAAYND